VQHHVLDPAAMVAVGDFLAHAGEWTGCTESELVQLLSGVSPESAGDSHELSQLRDAVRGDEEVRRLIFRADSPDQILAALVARPGRVGEAVREYLDLVSYRLADGIDPGHACLRERPALILIRLRTLFDPPRTVARNTSALDAVLSRVPEA